MPYVTEAARKRLTKYRLAEPSTIGELNYIISTLCDEYIARYKLTYHNINELIGVLECAKMELYRRVAVPYEDKKLEENGEVYHSAMKILYPEPPTTEELFLDSKQITLEQHEAIQYGQTTFGGG